MDGKNKTMSKKAEIRVELAKDVLKQLRYLDVQTGSYLEVKQNKPAEWGRKDNAKAVLCKKKKDCAVCALGSLFFAYIDKFNKVSMCDIGLSCYGESYDVGDSVDIDPDIMFRKIKRLFTEKQLSLIETSFEGRRIGISNDNYFLSSEETAKCLDFYEEYDDDPKERLRAIMKNIVKNNGTFVL